MMEKTTRRPGYTGYYCVVPGCCSSSGQKRPDGTLKYSMFNFPKDDKRLHLWLNQINLEDLHPRSRARSRICNIHFETKMFLNDLQNRLQPTAIPTLNLPLKSSKRTKFPYCEREVQEEEEIIVTMEKAENVNNPLELEEPRSVPAPLALIVKSEKNESKLEVMRETYIDLNSSSPNPKVTTGCTVQTQTYNLLSNLSPRKEKLLQLLRSQRKKNERLSLQLKKFQSGINGTTIVKCVNEEQELQQLQLLCAKYLPIGLAATVNEEITVRWPVAASTHSQSSNKIV